MYFGGGMIPTYLTVVQMGLNNTIWAVMLPGAVSVYNMIVFAYQLHGHTYSPDRVHDNRRCKRLYCAYTHHTAVVRRGVGYHYAVYYGRGQLEAHGTTQWSTCRIGVTCIHYSSICASC